LEEIATFVTRCVSEGYQAVSLAYAAGYEKLSLAHGEKEKGPGYATRTQSSSMPNKETLDHDKRP